MIRFGLCCQFVNEPIKFRTTTAAYLRKIGNSKEEFLSKLVLHNAEALGQAIQCCSKLGVGCFRISSRFLPVYTHPEVGYQIKDLPDHEEITKRLKECRKWAEEHDIRLTFHPDQFVVLSSPDEGVIERSLAEIEYQAIVAELIGADVINIHAGGVYGDKKGALKRFESTFDRLSHAAREKLTVENDDKSYTPNDLFPLCQDLGLPLVYDIHHHRCLPDGHEVEETTDRALETWNREPLFHLSSPKNGWGGSQLFKHHDYIDPRDFPRYWFGIESLTIEIEAKAKEQAVKKIMENLKNE